MIWRGLGGHLALWPLFAFLFPGPQLHPPFLGFSGCLELKTLGGAGFKPKQVLCCVVLRKSLVSLFHPSLFCPVPRLTLEVFIG